MPLPRTFNLSLSQMKEVRRGILLAKHDYQLLQFEANHKDVHDPIVGEIYEVYVSTEKLIMGDHPMTDLTVEAYCRTMDKLRGDELLPND